MLIGRYNIAYYLNHPGVHQHKILPRAALHFFGALRSPVVPTNCIYLPHIYNRYMQLEHTPKRAIRDGLTTHR